MPATMWTAPRRLYLDDAGNVVEADDPKRVSLLVAQGGVLPLDRAEQLGLVKAAEPKANKARSAPANKSK